MSVLAPVPPYFDVMIEGFRRGETGRCVHLGHWDPSGTPSGGDSRQEFARAQHRLDEQMLALADLRDGQHVLDVGCGFGGTLEMIGRDRRGMSLVGVNIDPRQLEICRTIESVNGNRLEWREADACRLPFADRSFDHVLCVEAMFHFASRRRFFEEAARLLKPGGTLVASDIVVRSTARALEGGELQVEEAILGGFGPWPDFWGSDADHKALGSAAGLRCAELIDATANTAPSHRFTAPPGLDARRYRGDAVVRAALMLGLLHREGHLRYFYMRFDKPA